MNITLRKITACIALSGLVTDGILVGCSGNYDGTSGGDFLDSGRTASFFTALQVDPPSEDSAGPQFVVAEDLNADGLLFTGRKTADAEGQLALGIDTQERVR